MVHSLWIKWLNQIFIRNVIIRKHTYTLREHLKHINGAPKKKNNKELGYKALVQPVLEYVCGVWDPYCKNQLEKIEKTERRAAKFAMNNYKKIESDNKMNKDLKQDSLEKRQKKARLQMFYKIKTEKVHNQFGG